MDGPSGSIPAARPGADPATTRRQPADADHSERSDRRGARNVDPRRDGPDAGRDSLLTLRAQWVDAHTATADILHRGGRLRQHLDNAERALERARQQGNRDGIEALTQRISDLSYRRTRLLVDYERARAAEGQLGNALRAAGIDPASINHSAVARADAAQRRTPPTWANDPATGRQLDTLRTLLARSGLPDDTVDARLTKAEADRSIKAILAGELPLLRATDEATPPAAPQASAHEVLIERIRAAVLVDADLTVSAQASSNTFAQFQSWALARTKTVMLDAVVGIDDTDTALTGAAQSLLADPARLDALPHELVDLLWQTHHRAPEADPTEPDTTGPETTDEAARQHLAQNELDNAATAAIVDFDDRGRRAYDPRAPFAAPDPSADPVVGAALESLPSDGVDATQIRADFIHGCTTAASTDAARYAAAATETSLPADDSADTATPREVHAAPVEVPQYETGEPLTSPLWRSNSLIAAQRPDGSTVYISADTARRYADVSDTVTPEPEPQTATEPEATPEPETAAELGGVDAGGPSREPLGSGVDSADHSARYASPAVDFVIGTDVLVPSGAKARARANLDALAIVQRLATESRPATDAEQDALARWSGWGGVPQIFDTAKTEWEPEREELRTLLSAPDYAAARLSTVNAHYTDPAIASALWRAVERAGLPEGARVLEPGCGSGHFVGLAPTGTKMVGVELDPITAAIAHHLYPNQHIRNHGFEAAFAGDGTFTATIGNVPFGDYPVYDDIHNPNSRSIHNHFIIKSLHLTAPGGYVAVITSTFTSDSVRPAARREIAALGDLVGGVRLPSAAHRRQAATDVLTDVLIFRRREPGREATEQTTLWTEVTQVMLPTAEGTTTAPAHLNRYFNRHRDRILGTIEVGSGMYGSTTMKVVAPQSQSVPALLTRALESIVDDALDSGLAMTAAAPDRTQHHELDDAGLHTDSGTDTGTIPGTLRFDAHSSRWEQYQVGAGWVLTPAKGREINDQWQRLLAMGDTVLDIGDSARTADSTPEHRQDLREKLDRQYTDYTSRYGFINRFKWTNHATENSPEKTAENFTALEAQWRIDAAQQAALDRGVDPDDVADLDLPPYRGEMPAEVTEALLEKARTPAQGPRKSRHHLQGAISFDPRMAMVRSLELFDDETEQASKTSIFDTDVTFTTERATSAAGIDEAIAIAFDESGRIDPERVAELLDTDVEDVLDRSRGKIYPSLTDPSTYEVAGQFLAGDVRSKLARARVAEAENPDVYTGVVDALEAVVPPDADPARIGVRPGAEWVGVDNHKQFLVQEFGIDPDELTVSYAAVNATWQFETSSAPNWDDPQGYEDPWGIAGRYSGLELFTAIANNKPVEVLKTESELDREPKPRFHPKHTTDLRNRAVRLEEKFVQWLWSDPARYEHLTEVYNGRFNRFVKPQFATEHKQYPGLNPNYIPYYYQRQAEQRLTHGETILLDHCVGSGKTLTITISCMEMRRLGHKRQPWVVVPNHLVDQWAAEVRDAYPAAKVLVGGDLSGPRDRQRFIGQTAVTDWDMVIVPESVMKLIAVSKDTELAYIETRMMELREGLERAKEAGGEHTVKQIERVLKREQAKQQKLVSSKASDTGLTFEQSGCDFLWVDEAHYYKNLARTSNSADLSLPDGSQRASDLEMKARWLRDRAILRNVESGQPDAPAKAIAFATGTPVSNSLSELWVMNRYLRPDLLDAAGIGHIDAWAQTFAKQRTTVEMNITGTSLRPISRMAEYQNLRQLIAMVDQFRDVVTEDQIPVELPRMRTGKPLVVEFDLAPQVRDFMFDLDERMAATSGRSMDVDNALKISNDGRNASLHPTLAKLPEPEPEHDRVAVAADLLWNTHLEHRDLFTPADRHGPDARGVFQMVFCDRGTPKAGGAGDNSLYARLREALVDRGMERSEVVFIHDYPTPKQKQQLFADCRAGKVRVLIGSTPKLGTGVNAQRLLKQLISLDPAWTAADMQQRFGRIIRQGNVHREVDVVNIVARRSYDATMWQIIERKAHSVQQLRGGEIPDTMEDVGGDIALSAAQTKAAATGDPVYVRAIEQQAHVDALESEQTMIANANASRRAAIDRLDRAAQRLDADMPTIEANADRAAAWLDIDDRAEKMITIDQRTAADDDTESLVDALQNVLQTTYIDMRAVKSGRPSEFAEIAGVAIAGTYRPVNDQLELSIPAGPKRYVEHRKLTEAMSSATAARGILQQMRNMIKELPVRATAAHADRAHIAGRLTELTSQEDRIFTRTDELAQARYVLAELKADVNARENSPEALTERGRDLDRRRSHGLYPKWSLDLNPTPAHADAQHSSRAALVESVPERMQAFAEKWAASQAERDARRADDPWKPKSPDGSRFQRGADRDSGAPGAAIQWTDRTWHWTAWTGPDTTTSGFEERRDAARYAADEGIRQLEAEPDAATSPNDGHTPSAPSLKSMLNRQANRRRDIDRPPPSAADRDRDIGPER